MHCKICLEKNEQKIIKFKDTKNNEFYICKECYEFVFLNTICCAKCNKVVVNTNNIQNNLIFADVIVKNNYIYCVECGENVLEKKSFIFVSNNFKGYCYKPNPQFYKRTNDQNDSKDKIFLGVELEIGGLRSNHIVRDFCDNHGGAMFYFKSDGSIRGAGCEIVTHPATLAYHESNESGWRELFEDFNKLGFVSGTTTHTGLHIHVSRNVMTEKDWKKVDLLINVARNFFEKCARRASTHYCSYNLKSHSNWGYSNSRYESVNFQNSHTVEFRIFNGTNDINELFASLELVKTIVLLAPKISYEELYENFASVKEKMVQISKDNNFKYLIDFMGKIKEKW